MKNDYFYVFKTFFKKGIDKQKAFSYNKSAKTFKGQKNRRTKLW